MMFPRSAFSALAVALVALVFSAAASATTFPQTVVDGSATSLTPTGLVFTLNSASFLTIGYNAQTTPSVVTSIKKHGFRGTVTCSGTLNGAATSLAAVTWSDAASSVTVALAPVLTAVNSCTLSQYAGSSSATVIVYFNAGELKKQEEKIEVAKLPKPTLHATKSLRGKSLRNVVKILQSQNPSVVFAVSPGSHNPAKYSVGVVYVRRALDGRIVEFQKLADEDFFIQVFSNHGKFAFEGVVTLKHLLSY